MLDGQGAWKTRYRRKLADYPRVLEIDPFEGWERNQSPEGSAEFYLFIALELAYAGEAPELLASFLSQVDAVAGRAFSENRLDVPPCQGRFPCNRARLKRALAYSRALRSGFVSAEALRSAVADFVDWTSRFTRKDWREPISQADFLAAVRMLAILGDWEKVRTLSKLKRMDAQMEESRLLLAMASDLAQDGNALSKATQDRAKSFFEEVRVPSYRPREYQEVEILRFEFGMILFDGTARKLEEIPVAPAVREIGR